MLTLTKFRRNPCWHCGQGKLGKLVVKLWLVTSKSQLVAAIAVSNEFNRNDTLNRNTTLILAMSAEDKPCIILNAFPKNEAAREYVIRFDIATETFTIPDGLHSQATQGTSGDNGTVQPIQPQVESRSEIGAQSLQLLEYNANLRGREMNIEVGNRSIRTDASEQEGVDRCFECHVPVRNSSDHADICSVKKWFVS